MVALKLGETMAVDNAQHRSRFYDTLFLNFFPAQLAEHSIP